jgi:hypothetical protein
VTHVRASAHRVAPRQDDIGDVVMTHFTTVIRQLEELGVAVIRGS